MLVHGCWRGKSFSLTYATVDATRLAHRTPFTRYVVCHKVKEMKIAIILFAMLFSMNSWAQEITFKVQFSENYALFEFVRHLSNYYPSNPFKEVYSQSDFKSPKNDSLITKFNGLNYFHWYNYEGYPYGGKIGGSTYFLLARNLIESKSLEEFKKKSFGVIPNSDLAVFYEILSTFQPIYQQTVYKPYFKKFNNQLIETQSLINQSAISRYFNEIVLFHNSSWDDTVPFYTTLYPIPDDRKKGFTATAFYNHAVGGIPVGLTDYKLLLSVIFHEAFHIIYDEQSRATKNEIDQWFKNNPSKSSQYAQLLFNEAITTSLANGYVYKRLNEKLLEGAWYNNEYIAKMAKAIYPQVNEYINASKKIDEGFIDKYIETFDSLNRTEDWMHELAHLTMNRYIVADDEQYYSAFTKHFRYNNIEENSTKLNTTTLTEMKSHPITKIVIVSNDNWKKLSLLQKSFTELSDVKLNAKEDFGYAIMLEDKTYLIVINIVNNSLQRIIANTEFKQSKKHDTQQRLKRQ